MPEFLDSMPGVANTSAPVAPPAGPKFLDDLPGVRDLSTGVDPLAATAFDTPEMRSARQDLGENFTPTQARAALAGRPELFPTALHLTRNADAAFELTAGFVPDEAARVQFHAARLGLPVDFVQNNLALVEEKLSYMDQRKVAENAPNVLEWLGRPENMAVAKDSIKHLAQLESLLVSRFGTVTQQAEVSMANLAHSTLKGFAGGAQATAEAAKWFLYDAPNNVIDALDGVPLPRDDDAVNSVFATAVQFWREAADSQDAATVPFTDEVKGVKRFALDLAPATAQIGVGALVTVAAKNPAPLIAAFGVMEGGGIYHDLREQQVGQLRALLVGAGVGVVNGYLESLQIGKAVKLADVGRKMAVRELATTFVENATQETIQNVVGTAGTLAGEAGVRDIKAGEYVERLKESVGEGAYEGLLAGVASLMFAAPRLRQLHQTYHQGVEQAARLDAALKVIEQSPLGQRSPDVAADAVNHITGGKQASLPAEAIDLMFQDDLEVRADFLQKLGVSEEKYKAALATGDDVEFALGNWVKVQGAAQSIKLFDHLRTGDALTRAELAGVKEDLIGAVTDVHESLASFDPETADVTQVKAIRTALIKEGGMSAADADRVMLTFGRGASRMAKASGETMQEWADRALGDVQMQFREDGAEFVRQKRAESAARTATTAVAAPVAKVDPLRDVAAIPSQPWVAERILVEDTETGESLVAVAGQTAQDMARRANATDALLKCLEGAA
jgi:hypothetical protein